jgi:hypothetical protein
VPIIIFDATVQGDGAPASLVAGIQRLEQDPTIDVVVVTRAVRLMQICGVSTRNRWCVRFQRPCFERFDKTAVEPACGVSHVAVGFVVQRGLAGGDVLALESVVYDVLCRPEELSTVSSRSTASSLSVSSVTGTVRRTSTSYT